MLLILLVTVIEVLVCITIITLFASTKGEDKLRETSLQNYSE